jgi:hypothetical protein
LAFRQSQCRIRWQHQSAADSEENLPAERLKKARDAIKNIANLIASDAHHLVETYS